MATGASLRCHKMHYVAERTPHRMDLEDLEDVEAEVDPTSAVPTKMGRSRKLTHSR